MGMGGGRPPDIAQMVERMPSITLDGLKVGDTVVMSSTKGAVENEYTAIVLLDNAEMLIRMATTQRTLEPVLAEPACKGRPEFKAWVVDWAVLNCQESCSSISEIYLRA